MDGVARAVRQAHHQQCQGTLDGQAHRAPAVVLRDGGDHHVIGGELVAEALVRRIRDGSKGVTCVWVRVSEPRESEDGGCDAEIDCHSYPDGVALFDDPDALQARVVSALDAAGSGHGGDGMNRGNRGNRGNSSSGAGVGGAPARFGGEHARGVRLPERNPSALRIVAIDGGVSSLMCRHGPRWMARMVDAVRRNPNTYCVVLGCVHDDMHDEHEVSLVCPDPVAEVHVLAERRVVSKLATAKGCKRTERCTFEAGPDGGAVFCGEGDAVRLASLQIGTSKLAASSTSSISSISSISATSSISSIPAPERSEAERLAKSNVVLPYERQGHARVFADDADFREYLPVEAGGWMAGGRSMGGGVREKKETREMRETDSARSTHRLGTIKYLRGDSDDESLDSDEDPDDDVDI